MARLRDDRFFGDAIDAAAAKSGLPPGLLEKDYWVSEVLRELSILYRGEFLFKGGTSLSKAYGLIERFSEDIDLLVLTNENDHADAIDARLDRMWRTAAGVTGGTPVTERHVLGSFIDVQLPYPATKPRVGGLSENVRLEPGIAGGPLPREVKTIRPMLAEHFPEAEGYSIEAYEDLTSFELDVLHPARTLIEKLSAVNVIAEKLKLQDEAKRVVRSREARHFYDIYYLLDPDKCSALDRLKEEGLSKIVEDCEEVNQRWYAGMKVRPEGGFGASVAFTDTSLAPALRRAYDKAVATLCFPTATPPTWDQVCARVVQHSESL